MAMAICDGGNGGAGGAAQRMSETNYHAIDYHMIDWLYDAALNNKETRIIIMNTTWRYQFAHVIINTYHICSSVAIVRLWIEHRKSYETKSSQIRTFNLLKFINFLYTSPSLRCLIDVFRIWSSA